MRGFRSIVSFSWIMLFLVWGITALTTKPTRARDTPLSRLTYLIPTMLAYFLMFSPRFRIGGLGQTWIQRDAQQEAVGTALTVIGVGIAIWARLSIGSNWSGGVTIKEGHQLVCWGPYAWVRHPIYSGIILAMIGTALLNRRWAGVAAVVLISTTFYFKSLIEEQVMRRLFGQQYDEYCARTGAFLPHL